MKKNNYIYIIKYCLLVGILLIGLSCDEASDSLGLNSAVPDYELTLNLIGSSSEYYADSCENCEDPNPIEIQATLKRNSAPVEGELIIFSYDSDSILVSDPFSASAVETSTSGIAKTYYNDYGQSGPMQITATYVNTIYPDTAWTVNSDVIEISPYYSLVGSFDLLFNVAEPQIVTDGAVNNSSLEIIARVKDTNGMPLQYMPVRFSSSEFNVLISDLDAFTD